MQRFDNKVALVTGAASGIGKSTAIRLAQEGASVMLADINEEGLEETRQAINDIEGESAIVMLDVSSLKACQNAVASVISRFGKLDVLCNIAGIFISRRLTDIQEEEWNRMVGINLNSVFFLSQAAMPHLIETKGNIINMASTAGLVGQVYNAMYCATKGAVVMLSKSMAVEYARSGVRVNAVCPGGVNTPLAGNLTLPEDPDMDLFMRLMPLLDIAEADEIASAVAYLASDEARYVTGTAFTIDGGQTAN
jgi:meso-butanediol dehydrogenase/(S,S)-butanediol dehydrogenase/diacetyl reductase